MDDAYKLLATAIIVDERYSRALASCITSQQQEVLADSLIEITKMTGGIHHIIRALTDEEFERQLSIGAGAQTVLRAECLASKLIRKFVLEVGSSYLKDVLYDPVGSIVLNGTLDLEIDPSRVRPSSDDNGDDVEGENIDLEERCENLSSAAQHILDTIFDERNFAKMPRDLQAIAGCIAVSSNAHGKPDSAIPLIGGFIMLRFFNPAILNPALLGFAESDLTLKTRRNLTLVAKLIQNLSNNVLFGMKEPYMIPLNSFLQRNEEKMNAFLARLASTDVSDLMEAPSMEGLQGKMDGISAPSISVIHALMVHHRHSIMKWFRNLSPSRDAHSPVTVERVEVEGEGGGEGEGEGEVEAKRRPERALSDSDVEITALLTELGPAPDVNVPGIPSEDAAAAMPSAKVTTRSSRSFSGSNIFKRGIDSLQKRRMQVQVEKAAKERAAQRAYESLLEESKKHDLSSIEALKAIYVSGTDDDGRPLVYIIPSLINIGSIDLESLLMHLVRVLDPIVHGEYAAVFCQANMRSENRPDLLWLRRSYNRLSRPYKKNLKYLYIVHPSLFTKMMIRFAQVFVSEKFWRKLIRVDNIAALEAYIASDRLDFPEDVLEFDASSSKKESRATSPSPSPPPVTSKPKPSGVEGDGEGKKAFGVDLHTLYTRECEGEGEGDDVDVWVPRVVSESIDFIELKGLEQEGILRISGAQDDMLALARQYDANANDNTSIDSPDLSLVNDVNVVSSLLKKFLREIPGRLLCDSMIDEWMDAANIDSGSEHANAKYEQFSRLVNELPAHNRTLLRKLISLLQKIIERKDVNKMSPANVATCIGPACLEPSLPSDGSNAHAHDTFKYVAVANSVVLYMLSHPGVVFGYSDGGAVDENEEEEAEKRLEEEAAEKKRLEEEATEKKRLEEEAAEKKRLEEETAEKKRLEEEEAEKEEKEEVKEENEEEVEESATQPQPGEGNGKKKRKKKKKNKR